MKISRNYTHGMVLTFGNHDTYAQDYESDVRDELFGSHVNLLLSESMTINDIQIHANPYSHAYGYNFLFLTPI